ncbi:MAG TPA: ATP-binding protein [candidate division Zixibacteria bacterium]
MMRTSPEQRDIVLPPEGLSAPRRPEAYSADEQSAVERLSRSEKMAALGEMASGVIHDFNNLLGAILGRVQLLRTKSDPDEVQRHITQIEKIALQGAETVKRLQAFTRRGQQNEFAATDLSQVVSEALELTRHRWESQAQANGVIYQVERAACSGCYVDGIHSELVDVVANLIFNALDAMPDGGPLRCRLRPVGGRCLLEIEDEGSGMPAEQLEQVFYPFYTTKGAQGTGLGLAVAYGVITRHGGEIRVNSAVGVGTTFTIDLPQTDKAPEGAVPRFTLGQRGDWRVLLIDDDQTILDVMGEALTEVGYRVTTRDNGAAAIVELRADRFDIVVTDLGMPGVTGWEVARHAYTLRPRVPVIVISGWGAQIDEAKLANAHVDAVLAKPFHLDQLRDLISQVATANTSAASAHT